MAQVIWLDPVLDDLIAIADFIALNNQQAAYDLVQRVFRHVEQLAEHPESGSRPQEVRGMRYRQIIEPPCRVFYRYDGVRVLVLFVIRSEMRLRQAQFLKRDQTNPGE